MASVSSLTATILAALLAGGAAGAKETASDAIKDAYGALKGLIRRRFGGNRQAEAELEGFERQPEGEHAALSDRLRAVGADRDEELLKAAQALMERIDPPGAKAGKYNVQITGGKGIVLGDSATVTMTFSDGD